MTGDNLYTLEWECIEDGRRGIRPMDGPRERNGRIQYRPALFQRYSDAISTAVSLSEMSTAYRYRVVPYAGECAGPHKPTAQRSS